MDKEQQRERDEAIEQRHQQLHSNLREKSDEREDLSELTPEERFQLKKKSRRNPKLPIPPQSPAEGQEEGEAELATPRSPEPQQRPFTGGFLRPRPDKSKKTPAEEDEKN